MCLYICLKVYSLGSHLLLSLLYASLTLKLLVGRCYLFLEIVFRFRVFANWFVYANSYCVLSLICLGSPGQFCVSCLSLSNATESYTQYLVTTTGLSHSYMSGTLFLEYLPASRYHLPSSPSQVTPAPGH